MANAGQKLYFSQWGGEQPIPPEFIAAMERQEEKQSLGDNTTGPIVGDPNVVESRVETNRTNERVRTNIRKKEGSITLRNIRTNDQGQPVQVELTMFPTGTAPTIPDQTTSVAVRDLGNGWSIQEVGVQGTYDGGGNFIPGIFPGGEYEISRPDPIPDERFKILVPTKTSEVTSVGQANTNPTLGTGDLDRREAQITQYLKRVRLVTRAGVSLPVTLTDYQTNPQTRQLETVVAELANFRAPTSPSATVSVNYRNLNDGTILEVRTTKAVFSQLEYALDRIDVVPEEMRAAVPLETDESTVAGTAALPTLVDGDLGRSEQQIDSFTKRIIRKFRSVIGDTTLIDYQYNPDFGGGVTRIYKVLRAAGSTTSQSGYRILKSFIKILGNGQEYETTEQLVEGNFPVLNGVDVDPVTNVATPYTQQVVDAATATGGIDSTGLIQTLLKPIDRFKTQKTVRSLNATALASYVRVFDGKTNIEIPTELTAVYTHIDGQAGSGSYGETGAYSIVAPGQASLSLRGEADGSAVATADLSFNVKQIWGNNVPCTNYLFLMPSPCTEAQIRARIVSILGLGAVVNAWPTFRPTIASVKCTGGRLAMNVKCNLQASDTVIVDSQGRPKGGGGTRSSGSGVSREIGINIKIIRLPYTIHGDLAFIGNASESFSFAASGSISSSGSGIVSSNSVSGSATGTVAPMTLAKTSGQATIPTSGLYLLEPRCEPHEGKYIKVHAQVINFALL